MAPEVNSPADLTIQEAKSEDILSIGTLHARAFHPLNDWHRRTFPATPTVNSWWAERYNKAIHDSRCLVLTAITATQNLENVAAILCMTKFTAYEKGAGYWTSFPRSHDSPAELYDPMVASMVEWREKLMLGRPHYLIEHFGVDYDFQRGGLGGKILVKAIELADREGVDIAVMANGAAAPFYVKHGFVMEDQVLLDGITECFLVRHLSK